MSLPEDIHVRLNKLTGRDMVYLGIEKTLSNLLGKQAESDFVNILKEICVESALSNENILMPIYKKRSGKENKS